jgi:Sulfotransferase domain
MRWDHLRYVIRAVLRISPAGRRLTVFPDDIFLVSYPRSGNTWARFLLGNLFHRELPITFANIESVVPEIYFLPDKKLLRMSRPRMLKSHEYFDPRYKRVIYFVRDPRDVAVSMYHYSMKRRNIADSVSMDEFIPRFVNGEFFVDFGTWQEHVQSWLATRRDRSGFLWIKYEEMLTQPEQELSKIASALDINATAEQISRAVGMSSAHQMRSLEREQSANWRLTSSTRQDIPFVREAKSGGWKTELSPTAIATIERAWGGTMKDLGYELIGSNPLDRELVRG